MDIIPATALFFLTSETDFSNYLLIVDAYSKHRNIYGMDNITTEEVMDQLDIFQYRFGKIDECGWCYLYIISSDVRMQFTATNFKEECQTHGVHLTLSSPEHQ